jgi:F0F1-type ATP synthase assembly protein I
MAQGLRAPFLPVLLFTCVCTAATWFGLRLMDLPFHWSYGLVIGYLAGFTLFLHRWQEGALHTDPKGFVRRFMTGLVLKMLISLFLLLAIVFLVPRDLALPLALTFALLYLAFLGFSTARLVGFSRDLPRP